MRRRRKDITHVDSIGLGHHGNEMQLNPDDDDLPLYLFHRKKKKATRRLTQCPICHTTRAANGTCLCHE